MLIIYELHKNNTETSFWRILNLDLSSFVVLSGKVSRKIHKTLPGWSVSSLFIVDYGSKKYASEHRWNQPGKAGGTKYFSSFCCAEEEDTRSLWKPRVNIYNG